MTHDLGRIIPVSQTITHTSPFNLVPSPGPLGGPRFVILRFDNVALSEGARLEVDLGYGVDSFSSDAGDTL